MIAALGSVVHRTARPQDDCHRYDEMVRFTIYRRYRRVKGSGRVRRPSANLSRRAARWSFLRLRDNCRNTDRDPRDQPGSCSYNHPHDAAKSFVLSEKTSEEAADDRPDES